MIMDRAIEILNSKDNVRVLYENAPVWIESIDKDTKKATVKRIGIDQTEEVLVSSLKDTGGEQLLK